MVTRWVAEVWLFSERVVQTQSPRGGFLAGSAKRSVIGWVGQVVRYRLGRPISKYSAWWAEYLLVVSVFNLVLGSQPKSQDTITQTGGSPGVGDRWWPRRGATWAMCG